MGKMTIKERAAYENGLHKGYSLAISVLQDCVNNLSSVQFAMVQAGAVDVKPIVVEIRGGCCVDVKGLLPRQSYEVDDWDNLEDEANG